jgi:hypothetical protein
MPKEARFGVADDEAEEVEDAETVERLPEEVVRGGCWLGVRLIADDVTPLVELIADVEDEPS